MVGRRPIARLDRKLMRSPVRDVSAWRWFGSCGECDYASTKVHGYESRFMCARDVVRHFNRVHGASFVLASSQGPVRC